MFLLAGEGGLRLDDVVSDVMSGDVVCTYVAHSEHAFRHLPSKEGCRKPVLGVCVCGSMKSFCKTKTKKQNKKTCVCDPRC